MGPHGNWDGDDGGDGDAYGDEHGADTCKCHACGHTVMSLVKPMDSARSPSPPVEDVGQSGVHYLQASCCAL